MESKEAKLIVLGSQGVGKTSLVWRYVGHKFSDHMDATIGASYFPHRLILEDKIVKFQIWDTAGQERFKSMASIYYRNANAAIIVFDITSAESFVSSKDWFKELGRCIHEPIIICLVGNKSDLVEERQVSSSEANQFAETINAHYFETSALDNTNIDLVFLKVATQFLDQTNPTLKYPDLSDSFILSSNGNITTDDEQLAKIEEQRTCCY